ncbi:10145_t:CDS:2 [Funneliformis mosseae]|uniref:10145_t:CDS:1 n=1 Tax=Funneliformis mosseae TaxID=27381 RepID=A0A9N9N9Q6_FUNMO|nr:10145_t:CDS:2 [Funneliformis mosseae]
MQFFQQLSGKSPSTPNVRQVKEILSEETIIETETVDETVEHEIDKETSSNIPTGQTVVFKEQPVFRQDVKEQVIDAPTVVQTTKQTTLTNDNTQSSENSKIPVKDNPEISEKSANEIIETSPNYQKIQFSEQEKPDHEASEATKKNIDIDEHLHTPEEVAERYRVDINTAKPAESRGLHVNQIKGLLEEYGHNILTPPKKKHPIVKYFECLFTLFNNILMIAGVLMHILFAIDQKENKSISRDFRVILNMIPQQCYVIRDGRLTQIQASTLVRGDVVFVKMGDKVPADLLIFAATDMKVDNSPLTGEAFYRQQEYVGST